MTLNSLRKIIGELECERKFGCLDETNQKRFETAVKCLKMALSDRLGISLYEDENGSKDSSGVQGE